MLAACSGTDRTPPGPNTSELRTIRVEAQIPEKRGDFRVVIRPGVRPQEIRRLTEEIASIPGVKLSDANYEQRVVGIVLEEGTARS